MSLKAKAVNGVIWNSIGNFSSLGIEFVVGIILARVLGPAVFGQLATIIVIIAVSEIFINSGFNQALVRKQDSTDDDYSTVFWFNVFIGILLYGLIFLGADHISSFFNSRQLSPLIQVLAISIVISSLTLIQRVKLTKKIDFKTQTKIKLAASVLSGGVAIALAYKGFGVWSLVIKTLISRSIETLLLWFFNRWLPKLIFNYNTFKSLFGFSYKLLLSGLLDTVAKNINYVIISKYFSKPELGFFTRAEMFNNLVSQTFSGIVTNVGYPVLATVQNDKEQFREIFRKMLMKTFFVVSILMIGMAAVAKALILTLIGNEWLPSVIMLQILCAVGVMYPLNSLNINILNVVGRSDLYLKLQLYINLLAIPNIFLGIFFGIKTLIVGMVLISIIAYIIINHESNKFLNYNLKNQLKDNLPSLLLALGMGSIVFLAEYFTDLPPLVTLICQVALGFIIVVGAGEIFKMTEYCFLKGLLLSKLRIKPNAGNKNL